MAEGVLVDLNDYSCVQEPFNPNIIDAVSLIEEEYNVDGTIDHLVDGKRENNTCHSNNSGINSIDMSRKRSSLKRRPPVNTRPNLFELKSKAETTDLLTSSEPFNEMGCLNTELQAGELTDESLKSRNCDSSNDVSVIRRDHRTSRVSRNSAGASGGVFVNTYKQGIDGFTEEIVSEPVFQNKNVKEISYSSEEPDVEEDFRDIDCHRILSIGGDDRSGRRAIVFSACRLPPKTEIDHQKLFRYMKYTLDQYVENDYSVVYFHHGLNSRNKPSISWLVQVYHELDRKYKKNLKELFVVHPTNFIKVIWNVLKPFISAKFGKKVMYVNRISELREHLHVDQLDIPDSVKKYDDDISTRYKQKYPTAVFHTPLTIEVPETQQFGVPLSWIKQNTGDDIPPVVRTCVEFLRKSALDVEGIFRRSANISVVKSYGERFNKGEDVEFEPEDDSHVAAVLLKKFLRELPEPLLTFELYDDFMRIHALPEEQKWNEIQRVLHSSLPKQNYIVLEYLMIFLVSVMEHSSVNRMSASNLAIVFGPNLIWAKSTAASLSAMGPINSITKQIIENVKDIFKHPS